MTPNLYAFLALIRQCEVGTVGAEGYKVLYGGSKFTFFADDQGAFGGHPNTAITAGGYTSTAAGAYQILYRTWRDFIAANGPHDFSPDNQDLCARWLIDRRHATAAVETGDIERAIALCGLEWASLPGSPYGQPTRTLEYCLQVYAANGGSLVSPATQPAPQASRTIQRPTKGIQEAHVGAELLISLIPSVLSLFTGRAQTAIAKATGDPVAAERFTKDFANRIEGIAGIPVTDQASAIKAVAAVASDQAKIQALEDHAVSFVLAEIGGGIGGAREANAALLRDYDDDPAWRIAMKFFFNPVNLVTAAFLYAVQQFIPGLAAMVPTLAKEAILGLVLMIFAVIAIVSAYFFGVAQQKKE